jgi:hypothetical protein
VSQDNTTKHKFRNANLHVIMQDPVVENRITNSLGRMTVMILLAAYPFSENTQSQGYWICAEQGIIVTEH